MHILSVAEAIEEFDGDMYFVLIEIIVVNDSRKLTMSLGASEERFCRCKRNLSVPDGYRDEMPIGCQSGRFRLTTKFH